jgi:low temperature requirement protein LtrA
VGTVDGFEGPVTRVTTLELFFDLVFVFTVTQLTGLLADDLRWVSVWQVAVLIGLIYWMYGGYAWLTNAVPARGTRVRALLFGGMCAYLVMALTVPTAFDGDGLTFGLCWLLIVALHTFLFVQSASDITSTAMRGFAPFNLVPAIAVAAAGAIGGTTQDIVFPAVVVFVWLSRFLHRPDEFEIGPAHFVERHGLLILVALGESVVAVGIGASHLEIDGALVLVSVLGLALIAELWWIYFGNDDDTVAEHALGAVPVSRRARVALRAFGDAHVVMLFGVVLVAVGLERTVANPGEPLDIAPAFALTGGAAAFLAGDVLFRTALKLPDVVWRLVAGAAVLLVTPVATEASAAVGLAVLIVFLAAVLYIERRSAR